VKASVREAAAKTVSVRFDASKSETGDGLSKAPQAVKKNTGIKIKETSRFMIIVLSLVKVVLD
jgi:hypothetical protein